MSEITAPLPETDREKIAVMQLLSIMRGDWDDQTVNIELDVRPVRRFGAQFHHGARDMGVTFTLRAWCDRPRDAEPDEIMDPPRSSHAK